MRILAAVVVAAFAIPTVSAAQERWVAATQNSEAGIYFGFGPDVDTAIARSERACKRVSRTCTVRGDSEEFKHSGATNEMSWVFTLLCCSTPRFSCTNAAGPSVEDARRITAKIASDAGFTNCTSKGDFSASNGKRLK